MDVDYRSRSSRDRWKCDITRGSAAQDSELAWAAADTLSNVVRPTNLRGRGGVVNKEEGWRENGD